MTNWLELIGRRQSIRQYEKDVSPLSLSEVGELLPQAETLNNSPLAMHLVSAEKIHPLFKGFLGRFARVMSPWYIVPVTINNPMAWLNLGFALEKTILEMTGMDLGTCWLGGYYDREKLASGLGLKQGSSIPAIVAWGHPSKQTWNKVMKKAGRLNARKKVEDIIHGPMPDYAHKGHLRPLLEAVRWAPSAVNRQPWRLEISPEAVHFYSVSKKAALAGSLVPIDMGIALCHFSLGCRQLNVPGRLERLKKKTPRGLHYWYSYVFASEELK